MSGPAILARLLGFWAALILLVVSLWRHEPIVAVISAVAIVVLLVWRHYAVRGA